MKTEKLKEFYFITHPHDHLTIHTHTFRHGARPLLWGNRGLFCLISRQKVENIINLVKDKQNLPVLDQKRTIDMFHWEDGELITARAAAMLLS